jgi:CRISPR-associated protein (TIGR02584 family)
LVISRPPVDVREVRVITTRAGAARVQGQLLHPTQGWFPRFCRDFGIPAGRIRFEPSGILVPAGADGEALEDVRTPADNTAVADAILALVRDLTRNPGVALHCSVAGGRKTMGLFLGIAFQLFARPQDRLSHVLAHPPEMEGHREFFYPPPRATTYRVNGRAIHSRDIRVELAEIPVLLLRERLQAIGLANQSYSALIAQAQRELDRLAAPPPLVLDGESRSLRIGGEEVHLTPLQYAVYEFLARRRAQGCGEAECPGCPRCSLEAGQFLDARVLADLRECLKRIGVRDERARSLQGWRGTRGEAGEPFLQVRSRINGRIRRSLGSGRWTNLYVIASRRPPGALARYFIPMEPTRIAFG